MIVTPRLLWLLAIGIVPLAASGVLPILRPATLAYDLGLLLLALVDTLRCPRPGDVLQVERICHSLLSVATENEISVRVASRCDRPLRGQVRDAVPAALARSGDWEAPLRLPPHGEQTLTYRVVPPTRGDYDFGDIAVRLVGPLGLIVRQENLPAAATVPVYPNVRAVGEYDLRARQTHRTRAGSRRTRLSGGGREFASLRDYTPDDEFRAIDWKATARRGLLTARTFEAERTQDIVLLIDEGRRMLQEVAHSQKLDHVVSAALLLAHAVARADDRIGLLTFAGEVRRYLPPRRGRGQTAQILQALYAARADAEESDYRAAFRFLASRWRKRSLIVLFTDLVDPVSSEMLLEEIARLGTSHLVVCVTVRDPQLTRAAMRPAESVAAVYERTVAEAAHDERALALALLAKRAVLVVDAEPETLSADLVARYLAVKAQSLL